MGRKTQELANSGQLKTHLQMGCGAQVFIFSTLRANQTSELTPLCQWVSFGLKEKREMDSHREKEVLKGVFLKTINL